MFGARSPPPPAGLSASLGFNDSHSPFGSGSWASVGSSSRSRANSSLAGYGEAVMRRFWSNMKAVMQHWGSGGRKLVALGICVAEARQAMLDLPGAAEHCRRSLEATSQQLSSLMEQELLALVLVPQAAHDAEGGVPSAGETVADDEDGWQLDILVEALVLAAEDRLRLLRQLGGAEEALLRAVGHSGIDRLRRRALAYHRRGFQPELILVLLADSVGTAALQVRMDPQLRPAYDNIMQTMWGAARGAVLSMFRQLVGVNLALASPLDADVHAIQEAVRLMEAPATPAAAAAAAEPGTPARRSRRSSLAEAGRRLVQALTPSRRNSNTNASIGASSVVLPPPAMAARAPGTTRMTIHTPHSQVGSCNPIHEHHLIEARAEDVSIGGSEAPVTPLPHSACPEGDDLDDSLLHQPEAAGGCEVEAIGLAGLLSPVPVAMPAPWTAGAEPCTPREQAGRRRQRSSAYLFRTIASALRQSMSSVLSPTPAAPTLSDTAGEMPPPGARPSHRRGSKSATVQRADQPLQPLPPMPTAGPVAQSFEGLAVIDCGVPAPPLLSDFMASGDWSAPRLGDRAESHRLRQLEEREEEMAEQLAIDVAEASLSLSESELISLLGADDAAADDFAGLTQLQVAHEPLAHLDEAPTVLRPLSPVPSLGSPLGRASSGPAAAASDENLAGQPVVGFEDAAAEVTAKRHLQFSDDVPPMSRAAAPKALPGENQRKLFMSLVLPALERPQPLRRSAAAVGRSHSPGPIHHLRQRSGSNLHHAARRRYSIAQAQDAAAEHAWDDEEDCGYA